MNAVLTKQRIEFYMDVSRSARFFFSEISLAVNDAVQQFIDEKFGDETNRNPEGFQLTQQLRDDLYTLIKTHAAVITTGTTVTTRYGSFVPSHFIYPTDYYDFISLVVLIDSYSSYSKMTTYNEVGPLLQDSFKMPSNQKTYVNETSTGFTVWRGTGGTVGGFTLTYLKAPTTYSIGTEANVISAGGTLVNLSVYLALEISVYSGVTYAVGSQVTGSGAALTSGSVILQSLTSPIDLPDRTHEEIAKRAAVILAKNTQQYDPASAISSEQSKP